MFDKIAAHREIEGRNRLRAEAHLPLVSVKEELRRYEKADAKKEFDDFIASPLRERVRESSLTRLGVNAMTLNGVRVAFYRAVALVRIAVTRRMERIWRRQRKAPT